MVPAAAAALHLIGVSERRQILLGHQRGHVAHRAAVLGDQRHAESPHEPRHVGTDHLATQELFQRPKHRFVIEGAALHHHFISQVRRFPQANDFVQRILDDRVGEAGGNICHRDAILLRLSHARIHEDRAARAQVHRPLRRERQAGEFADVHAQGLGESIQERAAARRASFIQQDVIHRAVLDAKALHILAADVKDRGHVRQEMLRPAVVRHGLYLADVRLERPLDELLAIARDPGAANGDACRKPAVEIRKDRPRTGKRRPFISAIVFVKDAARLIEKHRLDGSRSRIDAEPHRPLRVFELSARRMEMAMPLFEIGIVLFIFKKRRQYLRRPHGLALRFLHPREPGFQVERLIMHRRHRRADGYVELSVVGNDHILIRDVERFLETFPQHGLECQRASEERHLPVDRAAARETGNRLIHHRLENRQRDVCVRRAFIQKRLDVRLRKDAAARRDGIHPLCLFGELPEARRIHRKERRHTVDESPRPAGASAIHALIHPAAQVGDLLILAA